MRYLMGTLFAIEAEGPGAFRAVQAAYAELHRLDALLSTYKPASELSRVNREAGRGWTPVSAETAALVGRALALARETGGAFDPTVGPLVALWGFKYMDYRLPAPEAIARTKRLVGHAGVALDPARPAVRLARPGMALDLGATAKGYAVDRALAVLKRLGMRRARVDGGGNQAVWGPAGARWAFGVKHPRAEGATLGELTLSGGGVATAGDAERGFWKDGVRYGHVLDARTGWPARGRWSVTVVAPSAEEADALDTPLYVLGPERGRALLARHPGCAALFVEADGGPGRYRAIATAGLAWRPAPEAADAGQAPGAPKAPSP